jgi:hypothetical protein
MESFTDERRQSDATPVAAKLRSAATRKDHEIREKHEIRRTKKREGRKISGRKTTDGSPVLIRPSSLICVHLWLAPFFASFLSGDFVPFASLSLCVITFDQPCDRERERSRKDAKNAAAEIIFRSGAKILS